MSPRDSALAGVSPRVLQHYQRASKGTLPGSSRRAPLVALPSARQELSETTFTSDDPNVGQNARSIVEQQRLRDGINRQKTHHALTSSMMERESFDNVYSDRWAYKDTESALGTGTLVPYIDSRASIVRPKTLRYSDQHMVPTAYGDRVVLPSRSFLVWGAGPGRSIDF